MSPVNFCVTVARVTLGPGGAPAGFSFQSLISKPPLASFFNVVTSSGFRIDGWNNSPGLIRTLRKCGRGWKPDAEESEVLGPLALKARKDGAGDGDRTRYLNLGKVALCQMSYSR